MNRDIIVIGGGVAGMTAALNILRNGKRALVLEQETIGGQISYSPRVDNYPAISSISGSELSDKIMEQILALGADIEVDKALSITKQEGIFTVVCESSTYTATSVILANGVRPRTLGLDNESHLVGCGVSYCALCDGAFYANQEVVLVGDGNTALQYALFLSNLASKVTVCTLFDGFSADKCHVDNILCKPNIEILHNIQLTKLNERDGKLYSMNFLQSHTNEQREIIAQALFVAIGQIPDNDRFVNVVDIDDNGYIVSDESCKTRTEGLFVAGDTRTKAIRQLSTAIADGAVAGAQACQYLK